MATGDHVRPKRRWLTAALGTALGAAVTAGGLLAIALAINAPEPFELDGNAADGAAAGTDWASEYPTNLVPPGGVFIDDLTNDRIFTGGGTKDENIIDGWASRLGSPPDKDDIYNAYAIAKTEAGSGDQLIYFGADRFDSSGSAQMGFWFFEGEVKAVGNDFSGAHTDNDLLLLVEFTNGGRTADVKIYRWSQALFDDKKQQTSPLVFIGGGSATVPGTNDSIVVCNDGSNGEIANSACLTNNASPITVPWPYLAKGGTTPQGTIPARNFIEGVVNITDLVGDICISSFMAETRSSHETSAVLKDFALGDLNTCSVTVAKACDPLSRAYDSTNNWFATTHKVTLENDGGGAISDVEFQELSLDTTDDNYTACTIVNVGGEDDPANEDNDDNFYTGGVDYDVDIVDTDDWNPIAGSGIPQINLAAGAKVNVYLLCLSKQNAFTNSVTVRATSAGGSLIPANSDDTVVESDENVAACHLDVVPFLNVTKDCKGVSLDPTTLTPRVCATVTVENPVASNQSLNVFSVLNYPGLKGLDNPDNPPAGGVDLKARLVAANGGSNILTAGTSVSFDFCYAPTAADNVPSPLLPVFPGNPTPPPAGLEPLYAPYLDPGKVIFSDVVQVVATGIANNTPIRDHDDAPCKLCPTCPDCPPALQ